MAERTTTTRPLSRSDLARVVAIDQRVTGRPRTGFYSKRFAAVLDDRSTLALVAERGGRVVGFAFAHLLDGEFGGEAPAGVLDALGVDEAVRRGGVARSLLSTLETALRDRRARELRTQAGWSDHALAAFFAGTGFQLAPRLILERSLVNGRSDDPAGEDAIAVRSMTERDLAGIVRLDRKITGRERSAYYGRKAEEVLNRSGVRVSHVAEVDGQIAGFVMARVDVGEFGRTEPNAVLDTIGVDPALARRGVGRALVDQLLLNARALCAEAVVTEADWDAFGLLAFLSRSGFTYSQRLAFVKPLVAAKGGALS